MIQTFNIPKSRNNEDRNMIAENATSPYNTFVRAAEEEKNQFTLI